MPATAEADPVPQHNDITSGKDYVSSKSFLHSSGVLSWYGSSSFISTGIYTSQGMAVTSPSSWFMRKFSGIFPSSGIPPVDTGKNGDYSQGGYQPKDLYAVIPEP